MFSPVVQLKSGGYVVINPTEALVAIDVNSGRATREHHIEDTALRTNSEAAEEIARQLRLRDLAGLIVIDFIDMDENRNNRNVERKLKDALKNDRARIQVGRISHFGLMEMSRQRIRTGVLESSTVTCPACGGTGHVRAVSSVALHLLRSLEEHLIKSSANDLIVRTRAEVGLYLLNQKRAHLRELEQRFGINILIQSDASLTGQQYFAIDKGPQSRGRPAPQPQRIAPDTIAPTEEEAIEEEAIEAEPAEAPQISRGNGGGEPDRGRRRRRRRRGRARGDEGHERDGPLHETVPEHRVEHEAEFEGSGRGGEDTGGVPAQARPPEAPGPEGGELRRRRRRGRRGGRRNRRDRFEGGGEIAREPATAATPEPGSFEPFRSVTEPRPEPSLTPAAIRPAEPATEPQQPKRRSTVREPAPFAGYDEGSAPMPMERAAPLAPASETSHAEHGQERTDADRPRRSGWWRRK
jgi:ribonuclease E